nr:short chain dehydrogenase:reductase [Hymenolepis microstoma]CUU98942.1 short chain dehydrogenase:reductase [Hymenolepis microstoma]
MYQSLPGIIFLFASIISMLNLVIHKTVKVYQPQGCLVGRIGFIIVANSGIGLETAAGLVRLGATIILACRDINLGIVAKREIMKDRGGSRINQMS